MAAPKATERREPLFDGASASDAGAEAPIPRRPKPSDSGNRPKRKRRSRKRGGGGGGRWTVGRVAYWSAVVGLWLVIATIGGAAWVGAHLPPIQSLEIPKRPPSIKIVDLQGRLLATRGDMGGAAGR
jgi:penicillin-binding protein 1A